MAAKNHDYSGASGTTPFANFESTEQLGICKTEAGILMRMSDKIKRLITFVNSGELKVSESVEDACLDIINYSILFAAYRKSKQEGLNFERVLKEARDIQHDTKPYPQACDIKQRTGYKTASEGF